MGGATGRVDTRVFREVAGQRPWSFWQFDEKRDESIPEQEQVERLGLMTDAELAALQKLARGIANEMYEPLFRRSWSWWRLCRLSVATGESSKRFSWSKLRMSRRGSVGTARERILFSICATMRTGQSA